MSRRRLAWQTPTGAMIWEIWGRHRVNFLWQSVALVASACLVYWKMHGASRNFGELLGMASFCCFLLAYLHLLVCFSYLEFDARKVQLGFPGRLLLKPVSTARLVLVPMFFGGAVVVTVFALWTGLVLPHLSALNVANLLWISIVLLSLFWWLQALEWSLPWLKARSVVLLLVVVIHLLVLVLPQLPTEISSAWRWGILTALVASAVPAAWMGLTLMRAGHWEGPSSLALLGSRLRVARAGGGRKQFGSAFGAQFWLEWRRQGWVLPGFWVLIALLVVPLQLIVLKWGGVDSPSPAAIWGLLLVLPLVLSTVWGHALAKFDLFQPVNELPGYIAVRPLTNGGFVVAKLAMALAASAITWLVTAVAVGLCLALVGAGTLFSQAGLVTPIGPVDYLTGCAPMALLLVLWTWKNLVAGMGAGLTGRPWIIKLFPVWRLTFLFGLGALVIAARTYLNFQAILLDWLTLIMSVCLAAKLVVALAAFVWGLRRHAITARAIGWIAGGWLVGGLFVAAYANRVCHTVQRPDLWLWLALGGFLILPLADLALAPLALAWNRHR